MFQYVRSHGPMNLLTNLLFYLSSTMTNEVHAPSQLKTLEPNVYGRKKVVDSQEGHIRRGRWEAFYALSLMFDGRGGKERLKQTSTQGCVSEETSAHPIRKL